MGVLILDGCYLKGRLVMTFIIIRIYDSYVVVNTTSAADGMMHYMCLQISMLFVALVLKYLYAVQYPIRYAIHAGLLVHVNTDAMLQLA